MSDNHLKTPLALSLQLIAKGRAQDAVALTGRSWPCTVSRVVSAGIVEVSFQVNADEATIPKVQVPIAAPEWIRYPIQVGERGVTLAADVRLGPISDMAPATPPPLTQPGNLTGLRFSWVGSKAWSPPTDANALEMYGPNGVIIRDAASKTVITLTPTGIVIDLGGPLTINSNGHDVTVTGGGDVIAGGISLKTHTHPGVATGSASTGEPNP